MAAGEGGSLEQDRLALERRRLDLMDELERRKLDVERYKAKLQALSIGVPLFGAMLALVASIVTSTLQARSQFRIKAAEIVMSDSSPDRAMARARMLTTMFPGAVSDLNLTLDPAAYPDFENIDVKLKVLDLLVQHPSDRARIIDEYKRLFPGDRWPERLEAPTALKAP